MDRLVGGSNSQPFQIVKKMILFQKEILLGTEWVWERELWFRGLREN